ncbi:MAG: hypothetical protein GW855_14350 [Erythrobacter sp.]|nr:hypothetical protein [Erythrobacter sp.]NCQ65077.1 hypothetical protein [Alphaproteobacteria bacterium]
MLQLAIYLLDLMVVVAATLSAWFWLRASGKQVRRVSKHETFDYADINRLVVALNRAQILNARAAKATAAAALLGALRILLDFLP